MAHPASAAFPRPNDKTDYVDHPGLTKREYFAGLALQGVLSRESCPAGRAAGLAVSAADELLKRLSGSHEEET